MFSHGEHNFSLRHRNAFLVLAYCAREYLSMVGLSSAAGEYISKQLYKLLVCLVLTVMCVVV